MAGEDVNTGRAANSALLRPGCGSTLGRCSLLGDDAIRCTECAREVDEFTAIAERRGFWSDGCGEPLPFCPECASASLRRRVVPGAG